MKLLDVESSSESVMPTSVTESTEDILQPGHVVKEKWKVYKKIGNGGFGEIYECTDIKTSRSAAIKVESRNSPKQLLGMETTVLKVLQNKDHFCKLLDCGRNFRFNYLVMELLGPNLSEMRRRQPNACFSLSTTLRVGKQMLQAIRYIHEAGYLHRDIKPSNFAIGCLPDTAKTVYMVDFGLSRKYISPSGEIRFPRTKVGFRGTIRYASMNAHQYKELGRHDDLWSLFYLLVEFTSGKLPWGRIKDRIQVGEMKENIDNRILIKQFPKNFASFLCHLNNLTYFDDPDYELLSNILDSCMSRRAIKKTDAFDWERNENGEFPCDNGSRTSTYLEVMEECIKDCDISRLYEDMKRMKGIEKSENIETLLKKHKDSTYLLNTYKENVNRKFYPHDSHQVLQKRISDIKLTSCNNSNNKNFLEIPKFDVNTPKESQLHAVSRSKPHLKDTTSSQFAIIDDDNVSAVQQITKGGGPALTLVSKWQYSFDDSESVNQGIENNLTTQDINQVNSSDFSKKNIEIYPNKYNIQYKDRWTCFNELCNKGKEIHNKRRRPVRRSMSHPTKTPSVMSVNKISSNSIKQKFLFIGDKLISESVHEGLPRCWSCPTISLYIRSHLKPPLKQQASFDENVYEVDVMRNVAAKQKVTEEIVNRSEERRTSLPHLSASEEESKNLPNSIPNNNAIQGCNVNINFETTAGNKDLIFSNGVIELNPLCKSSSQKGILKKGSDKCKGNMLQRSLSSPNSNWCEREHTLKKSDLASQKHISYNLNSSKLIDNVVIKNNGKDLNTNVNSLVNTVKTDMTNQKSFVKSRNDFMVVKLSTSNNVKDNIFPSNVKFSPVSDNFEFHNGKDNSFEKSSIKKLNQVINGDNNDIFNSINPLSGKFSHSKEAVNGLETCDTKNSDEDSIPSQIPIRSPSKLLELNGTYIENITFEEATPQKLNFDTCDSLNNDGVILKGNPVVEASSQTAVEDGKCISRRQRANPECKYVKDESESKLNFMRRRHFPMQASNISRIPRPCSKCFTDTNSVFHSNLASNVHSTCHNNSVFSYDDELPQPTKDNPLSNHILPSRQIQCQVGEENFSSKRLILY